MGVDLMAITGHNLNAEEVLSLPDRIAKNQKLKEAYFNLEYGKTIKRYRDEAEEEWLNWKWHYENSVDLIEETWGKEEREDEDDFPTNFSNRFGLYIQRKTIEFCFYCKYSFFDNANSPQQEAYIQLARELMLFFEQDKIIFYPDSMWPQQEMNQRNLSISEIEEWANNKFGRPSDDHHIAIENRYFILRG